MQHSGEHSEKPTSSSSVFRQLSNPRLYRAQQSKDHPQLPQSICVPKRSERKWKWQHHSRRTWTNHITCESEARSQALELSDWSCTILSRQRKSRRRRQSLVVVDSGACKEAHQFCEAQCYHDVLEEYSDLGKPSFDRQSPSSDTCDTTDLTLKELAGLVLQLCSIRNSQF